MIRQLLQSLFGVALVALGGTVSAQISNIPFPVSQTLNGSVGASVIVEADKSSAVVFTNSRGSNVTARFTDFIITNGGTGTCYVNFANMQGDILLGEIAIGPGQTTSLSLGSGVPINFGSSLRAVKSELFGAACNSRLVFTLRGWYTQS